MQMDMLIAAIFAAAIAYDPKAGEDEYFRVYANVLKKLRERARAEPTLYPR